MISKKLLNFIGFQIVWWVCVFFAKEQIGFYLFASTLITALALHFCLIAKSKLKELLFFIVITSLGLVIDFELNDKLFTSGGQKVFNFPLWLIGMWAFYPSLIPHSLNWLQNRLFLQVIFGGLGGALTYYAGVSLGVLKFTEFSSVIFIGLIWSIFFPIQFLIFDFVFKSKSLERFKTK